MAKEFKPRFAVRGNPAYRIVAAVPQAVDQPIPVADISIMLRVVVIADLTEEIIIGIA
ncbi:RNase PH [Ahrensia sp. R2A130]|nr:RNase PH [Ahrensia sp. R2A130]